MDKHFDIPSDFIHVWKDCNEIQHSNDYRIASLAKMTITAIETQQYEKAAQYYGFCETHMKRLLAQLETESE